MSAPTQAGKGGAKAKASAKATNGTAKASNGTAKPTKAVTVKAK